MSGWWVAFPTIGGIVALSVAGSVLAVAYVIVGIERAITRRGRR